MAARLLLEHDITHLRAIPVADHDVIPPPDERKDLVARVLHILELFLVGALLVASEQRVAAEGQHG
jgi:hypothetical protein